MIIDLQRHWLSEYHASREKCLVELTEKLHQEFMMDQQKIRSELLQQFKDELEQTRADLENKHRENLKMESAKLNEKHKRELVASRKKQWCWSCDNEVSIFDSIYESNNIIQISGYIPLLLEYRILQC